jgi:hypothetical protein
MRQTSILASYQRQIRLKTFFSAYWTVCGCLHRINKLQRLIAWAKRKKLAPQQQYYQDQWVEEENRLWRYQIRSPHATRIAKIAVWISDLISPDHPNHRYSSARVRGR